ncbi:MAG TPA: DinB family protein [Thermoanaerobaculia bacterium]|nr:DinB family protein [Thermoanaerobaculia bacterium]
MHFDLQLAIPVLERTPAVLDAWLRGLPAEWTAANEGPETWSPFDVVGHLIDGEETDWIPRARIILSGAAERRFEPYDRFRHLARNQGRRLDDLLDELGSLRRANLETLRGFDLQPADLERTGEHPAFGTVTLAQLLATWVAHDLGHLAQIARAMARQHREATGPWVAYLPILQGR